MALWQEILVSAALVVGGFFGLVGSWGLVKLDNPMARLHGPTKATTLGVGGVLIASLLAFGFGPGPANVHEFLITLFLLLTAPITALFIAKMHLHLSVDRTTLPPTGTGAPWGSTPGAADTALPPANPPERQG